MRVGGIVLAGGKSSRMGRPKAWLPFGDELLLPRVVRIVGEVASPVVIVAAEGQELPPLVVEVVRDAFPDRGPLQGLLAGLEHLDGRADAVFVSACDAPLLTPAFVRGLVELLGHADAAVPDVDGQLYPLTAVYRLAPALIAVRAALAANRFAVRDLVSSLVVNRLARDVLTAFDPHLDSLRGANTPEEFAKL